MKKDSRDQMLRAYDDACRLLQFENFSVFLRYVSQKAQQQANLLKQARNRKGLEVLLIKESEPSSLELEAIVKAIRTLPYVLRKALPGLTKEVMKKLPHEPGGRPKAFKELAKRREVCEQILDLIRAGTTEKNAKQRVASRHGVSVKTVQRVWEKRAEILTQNTTQETSKI